jgi:pyridoxal phosphate enzyme (YggS family)
MGIAENLARVRERIAEAAARAGRRPEEVQLVAVSKTRPAQDLREAYAAGQRLFGENYAQELRDKAKALSDLADLKLHFIGSLQKNKARYVAAAASMFEALDDLELAAELDKRAAAANRILPVLAEVNLGEAQKGGVPEGRLSAFAEGLAGFSHLQLEGLMCIPPAAESAEQVRPYFRRTAQAARRLGLPALSMGMSADFEVAIEEGATLVRVGTAIFGERSYPQDGAPSAQPR